MNPVHAVGQRDRFRTAGRDIAFARDVRIRPFNIVDIAACVDRGSAVSPRIPVAVVHIDLDGRHRFPVVRDDQPEPAGIQPFQGGRPFDRDISGRRFRPVVPPEFNDSRSPALVGFFRYFCKEGVIILRFVAAAVSVALIVEFHLDNPAWCLFLHHLDDLHVQGTDIRFFRFVAVDVKPALHDSEFPVAFRLVPDGKGQPRCVPGNAVRKVFSDDDVLAAHVEHDTSAVWHVTVRRRHLVDQIQTFGQFPGRVCTVLGVDRDVLCRAVRFGENEGSAGQRDPVLVCFLQGDLRGFVRDRIGQFEHGFAGRCQDESLAV